MMIAYKSFLRASSFATIMATAVLVAGCTTTQPIQQCTPKEKARLTSNLNSTKAKLDRNKAELSRTRTEMAKQSCIGVSASKSPSCARLKRKEGSLQSEARTLEGQLTELNATIAGRSHAGRYVQECSANWMPIRKPQKKLAKAAPKKSPVSEPSRQRQPGQPSQPKLAKAMSQPVEDFVVPAYEAPEMSYAPTTQPKVQPTAYIAPVATTPPTERAYTEGSKVRVVGSSFYPDQAKPAAPQAPDHAPAP